jgi:hypothetical protein
MSVEETGYTCHCCGKRHDEIPLSFAADFPDPYANLSRDDRENRALVSSDQCIIDHEQFYLRGCLELPIIGSDDIFLWGVWARVHENDFDQIQEFWERAGRESVIGPFKGRLANSLSIYADTLNLKLKIEIQPLGQRPLFVLEEREHLLAEEQRLGLDAAKAREYACILMRKSLSEI